MEKILAKLATIFLGIKKENLGLPEKNTVNTLSSALSDHPQTDMDCVEKTFGTPAASSTNPSLTAIPPAIEQFGTTWTYSEWTNRLGKLIKCNDSPHALPSS